jgi:hypothetical protein
MQKEGLRPQKEQKRKRIRVVREENRDFFQRAFFAFREKYKIIFFAAS